MFSIVLIDFSVFKREFPLGGRNLAVYLLPGGNRGYPPVLRGDHQLSSQATCCQIGLGKSSLDMVSSSSCSLFPLGRILQHHRKKKNQGIKK
jgi:hypothetical protein